jgi:hypothetical protein
MTEVVLKKKKKNKYIGQNVFSDTKEEILDTETQIRVRLKKIMRSHIGIENAISSNELFFLIYGMEAEDLNVYKRTYWWSIIKQELRHLRRMNEMFSIIKGSKIFILCSDNELKNYIKFTDNNIVSIKNMQKNANIWVKKKLYRNF